jgi:TIGR03009 family protein
MDSTARNSLAAIVINLGVAAIAVSQQPAPGQPGVQPQAAQQLIAPGGQPATAQPGIGQPAVGQLGAAQQPVTPQPPQPPPGFQLNPLEQAQLDAVLNAWQQNNAGIKTFSCPFQRLEYDPVFGPKAQDGKPAPLYQNAGELSYSRPDKGSFQITETNKWQETPAPGQYIKQTEAIGDHWVCDGRSVYQYRPDLKQLVEHPIPPQLQGQAIVDGPLPFLFGAEAAKLKEKYWLKIDQQRNQDPNEVWIIAFPKYQAQAADFTEVDVVLDRNQLLPKYMQVWMPNRSHHVYIFDLANAKRNGLIPLIQSLFERPSVPFGWKRVVEAAPLQQAAAPQPQAR